MNFSKISSFSLILMLAFFCSCSDENETTLTDEEVVDIIEASLSGDTYGMEEQSTTAARMAMESSQSPSLNCSVQNDSTVMVSDAQGPLNYSYQAQFSYELVCNGLMPQQFITGIRTTGEASTTRIQYTGTNEFNLTTDQFSVSESNYRANGTYLSDGTTLIGINQNRSVNIALNITVSDLLIDKSSYEIQSGTSTFTINSTLGNGDSITKTGSINFEGNQAATIILNGQTYSIQL